MRGKVEWKRREEEETGGNKHYLLLNQTTDIPWISVADKFTGFNNKEFRGIWFYGVSTVSSVQVP